MKVKRIIPIIVAAVVIVGGITVYYTIASATDNSRSDLTINDPLFSTNQSSLYYKLEQAIGDEGMPSDSITVNLNNTVNINGAEYYRVYNYATRSAYTTPKIYESSNNNFSQLVSNPVYISNSGSVIKDASSSITKNFNSNLENLSENEKYNSIYQIVAEYVEGYTANNPNYKLSENDNYEGNLNNIPNIKIDLNNYKIINNIKCYKAIIHLNSKEIIIYAGLDGYIYIPSKINYEELFFPTYLNQNISVENSNV
mgnify:FL=1